MLSYRDFGPEEGSAFDEAVGEADAWIREEDVQVVTLETLGLPRSLAVEGSGEQILRVWYETEEPSPTIPSV